MIYDGTELVAIDAQAGKGKLTGFLGANLVSPRTTHLTKIVTDPKDAGLAWVSWRTLERQATGCASSIPASFTAITDTHGPLRALVVGEEWGQLYVSNFPEILTLYRQGGINFLGLLQNAAAQIENRYGRELARIWRKATAHTLNRGLPDTETLKDIEQRSGNARRSSDCGTYRALP